MYQRIRYTTIATGEIAADKSRRRLGVGPSHLLRNRAKSSDRLSAVRRAWERYTCVRFNAPTGKVRKVFTIRFSFIRAVYGAVLFLKKKPLQNCTQVRKCVYVYTYCARVYNLAERVRARKKRIEHKK